MFHIHKDHLPHVPRVELLEVTHDGLDSYVMLHQKDLSGIRVKVCNDFLLLLHLFRTKKEFALVRVANTPFTSKLYLTPITDPTLQDPPPESVLFYTGEHVLTNSQTVTFFSATLTEVTLPQYYGEWIRGMDSDEAKRVAYPIYGVSAGVTRNLAPDVHHYTVDYQVDEERCMTLYNIVEGQGKRAAARTMAFHDPLEEAMPHGGFPLITRFPDAEGGLSTVHITCSDRQHTVFCALPIEFIWKIERRNDPAYQDGTYVIIAVNYKGDKQWLSTKNMTWTPEVGDYICFRYTCVEEGVVTIEPIRTVGIDEFLASQ